MEEEMRFVLTGLLLCGMVSATLGDKNKAAVAWPRQWANDSIAQGSGESLEIYRDVSDLWFAARTFQIPGLFLELSRHHAFLVLTEGIDGSGPDIPKNVKTVRLALLYRKSREEPLREALRIRLKAKTMRSSRFKILRKVAREDPARFAATCREIVDAFWQDDQLEKE